VADASDFDLLVVGGGLAGASLATVLAREGASVLVVERERVYRDRVRGEVIAPWGCAEAKRLGLCTYRRSNDGLNLYGHPDQAEHRAAAERPAAWLAHALCPARLTQRAHSYLPAFERLAREHPCRPKRCEGDAKAA
jgi:choline dehydrogenase-like flavoprotein